MAPPLLTLTDIHLTFGSTPLFTGADLAVHARERLCLVGRNGSGKSTLLKIAAGELEFDDGERFFQPGTTVRYLPQEPDFSQFNTVLEYVEAGLEEHIGWRKRERGRRTGGNFADRTGDTRGAHSRGSMAARLERWWDLAGGLGGRVRDGGDGAGGGVK